MKISYNWLKSYLDINLPAERVSEILTEIGLEVEGLETFESLRGGLKGLVIGHVLERAQHPNADKLSVTKVDIGEGEPLQIVCGASNVAAGQKVVVATIGTTLYPTEGDSFDIKKSKIRGVDSFGMICAEDEIGIGTSHDGIMVLDENTAVGMPAANFFNVERDFVFEIGLTPNRSDATSHLGVAMDLAAYLTINEGLESGLKKPDLSGFKVDNDDLKIAVTVENTEACPRYSGVCISNLTVKESPDWLKNRLKAIGVRSINNVVDVTNFVLHEFGQPLHAFDYDQIKGQQILVKNLPKGTEFLALDEVKRNLHEEDLIICDGDSNGMCIGGVFGGINSGVTEKTTAIFLESAYFNPKTIRRTSMRHLLRTDAAKVFEKGADPNNTVEALKRAALLLQELAGGKVASDVIDLYPQPVERKTIAFSYENIARLIGKQIPTSAVKKILSALDMQLLEADETGGVVNIPTNKSDVTREADLIEEILRIYGFNKVDFPLSIRSALVFNEVPDRFEARERMGNFLASIGFNEMMGMSLVQTQYKNWLSLSEDSLVFIHNTSNQNMDLMRPKMVFSTLEAVLHNQNYSQRDLRLFEFGKTYHQSGENFIEVEHLTLALTGQEYSESWLNPTKAEVSYFTLKGMVENVLQRLNIRNYQASVLDDEVFAFGLKYHRGDKNLVHFGQISKKLIKQFDLKQPVFFADFEWSNVFEMLKNSKVTFEELPKYPTVRRDLSLILDKNVTFEAVASIAYGNAKKILQSVNLFDVYENEERLGQGKKSYSVSFIFQDPLKTLGDKEIDKLMSKFITAFEQQLQAVIRK